MRRYQKAINAGSVVHFAPAVYSREFGRPHAGADMVFNFPQLLAHAAKTRNLRAGTIVGSGPVSNKSGDVGYACIAEIRAVETIKDGKASTPFLKFGDRVKIEGTSKNSLCI